MNKPQNKKRCGNCGCYNSGRHHDSKGVQYSVCDADHRVDKSDECCDEWIARKYKRKNSQQELRRQLDLINRFEKESRSKSILDIGLPSDAFTPIKKKIKW